jgi:ribosomal protein L40E
MTVEEEEVLEREIERVVCRWCGATVTPGMGDW